LRRWRFHSTTSSIGYQFQFVINSLSMRAIFSMLHHDHNKKSFKLHTYLLHITTMFLSHFYYVSSSFLLNISFFQLQHTSQSLHLLYFFTSTRHLHQALMTTINHGEFKFTKTHVQWRMRKERAKANELQVLLISATQIGIMMRWLCWLIASIKNTSL
jgi:hypothetical protein